MERKGTLVRWHDERGFGFLKVGPNEEDIFIHITAFKDMPRRPVVGDIIFFHIEHREDGKTRAQSARIEGVAPTPRRTGAKKSDWHVFVFVFLIIILAGFLSYTLLFSSIGEEEDFTGYTCEGKHYCSQMTCKEARFYLKNCPNVEIDGDGDGRPCEQQCR